MSASFPKIAPSHGGSGPPTVLLFLGPVRAGNPNGITIGSAVFAQMTAECPYTLQWAAPPPSKLPIPMEASGPPSNTWFPAPTRVLNQNAISIGSAVFAGLTSVTDRQTDHATRSVTIGRNAPHLLRCGLMSLITSRPSCRRTVQSYSQCALHVPFYEGTCRAHRRHLVNTTELVLSTAHPSPQPKRHLDRFRRFCSAHSLV